MNQLCEDVKIEKLEMGIILNKENSPDILYLSEVETEVFNMLMENSLEQTIEEISKKYTGEAIETDIRNFYNELLEKGIFEK